MKLNFLKLKTKSYLKHNKSLRGNLPYKQAATIGIIFSAEDRARHELIKDFVKRLEHDGKKVTVLSFVPNKKENHEFLYDFFTEKDLSFWGNITSSTASGFANQAFDYLFYIDTEPNPLVLSLIARSKAKCRVGKYTDGNELYFELMIESKGGVTELIESIYKYTSILR